MPVCVWAGEDGIPRVMDQRRWIIRVGRGECADFYTESSWDPMGCGELTIRVAPRIKEKAMAHWKQSRMWNFSVKWRKHV